ncbi:MAG: aldo/keto reductase [Bacteroidia bacterium]|nr:aldo/keto reductase [Bacteroidia bacterium]MBT8310650.1 aldo/keto reductase [Bacteroidia bacterium]NNK29107.1 aldo/keto reductase [Flavobacteriaceae bacterium]NNL61241.1 aldo/keto reductase [Flavobacteriaceae bacterium]
MSAYTRREASKLLGAAALGTLIMPSLAFTNARSIMKRKIPSSGEKLPVVGLGTWQTFDVGNNAEKRAQLSQVLLKMKELGGAMIDSSPMYGTSESVVGDLTKQQGIQDHFFYATKVWTSGKAAGISQMQDSFNKMKRTQMDLMQIHNLVDWQTHVKTLREWKESGKIRYWGFTHYTNSSHETLAKLIKSEQPDFVQFNYSINERHAEISLLNVAKDQGTAVIINRPYDGGSLFRKTKNKALPEWCKDIDINSWGQFFLKYILSHEAVNCVIPGTSKVKHVVDNMNAGYGRLPDSSERKKMINYLTGL